MSDRFLLEECPNCKHKFNDLDLGYWLPIGEEITCPKCKKKIVATMSFEIIANLSRRKARKSMKKKNNIYKVFISLKKAKAFIISRKKQRIALTKKRFTNQRYKARKKMALGTHTFEEWQQLKKFYKNLCLCCKQQEPAIQLSEDHIIPLSMRGTDYIDNIQPLCISCNSRKHDKKINYK